MNTKTTRFLTLLLALSLASCAVSCGEDGNTDDPADGTEAKKDTVTVAAPAGRDGVKADLPENLDFKGDTVTILTRSEDDFRTEFFAEDQNGDIINDTIFNRTVAVTEALNCKYEVVSKPGNWGSHTQFCADVTNTVMAGDDAYDVISYYSYAAPSLALGGVLMNLYDVENLDLSKPWWHQRFIDTATVYGKLYQVTGDICLSAVSYRYAMFFNKAKTAEYIKDDLYSLVLNHQWTYDKFDSLVKDLYLDLNGNSERDIEDFYAFDANGSLDGMATGSQVTYTKKSKDGGYEWDYNTEKNAAFIETFYERLSEAGVWYVDQDDTTYFRNSARMFEVEPLNFTEQLRDMKEDYGILPCPMYDEKQETYYSVCKDHYSQIMVPTTCKNTALVGAFLELMSEYSYQNLTPSYYETAMKGKYLRDDESAQMFDMIIDGAWYDFAVINSSVIGDPVFITRNSMQHKTDGAFASQYATKSPALFEKLTALLAQYKG